MERSKRGFLVGFSHFSSKCKSDQFTSQKGSACAHVSVFYISPLLSVLAMYLMPCHLQVWNTGTCEFVRTLNGHRRGIACLQYRDRLVVSGSSDFTIRYRGHVSKQKYIASDSNPKDNCSCYDM